MEFLDPQISNYADVHTTPESDLLKKIHRDTYSQVFMPRMISGHLQGRVLSMVSHLVRPHRILELGTYTGYSAICLAEGLRPGGKLITIELNEELEDRIRGYIKEAGLSDQVDLVIGKALEIIPRLEDSFDLVFIDADKENYSKYYNLIIDRVNLNGVILADNVLWSGKVLSESSDRDTEAVKHFNQQVQNDPRVENVLLPIRDGIMVIRKISS